MFKFKPVIFSCVALLCSNAWAGSTYVKDDNFYCESIEHKKSIHNVFHLYTPCNIKSKGEIEYYRSYSDLIIYDEQFMVVLPYYYEERSNFDSPFYFKANNKEKSLIEKMLKKDNFKVILASKKYTNFK